jgi:small nuclear ribonucleoprotein (snRNP)-like protein
MTVKELIEVLNTFSDDVNVYINDAEEVIVETVYKTQVSATHALGEVHIKKEEPKVIIYTKEKGAK